MRGRAGFAAHDAFDFPAEWDVAASASGGSSAEMDVPEKTEIARRHRGRVALVDQLRTVVRHLGHRLRRETDSPDRLSDALFGRLESVVRRVAQAEYAYEKFDEVHDWPFECLSMQALDLLNLELLEETVALVRQLDAELGFELVLASEASYGYNAQTRRFVDSRNGSWEVTPWMITQFPRVAKHIEELVVDGRVLRAWSEVYDRSSGRLLSVSALGEPFASIALKKEVAEQRRPRGSPPPEELQGDLPEKAPAAPELPIEAGGERRPDPHSLDEAALDASPSVPSVGSALPRVVGRESTAPSGVADIGSPRLPPTPTPQSAAAIPVSAALDPRAFRRNQWNSWEARSGSGKREAHVRVALLQMFVDITYAHPMMEACPSTWPFCPEVRTLLSERLKPRDLYEMLARATAGSGSEHLWTNGAPEPVQMMSWAEHRRRRVLERVIDSCEAFKVDLLVLPEYQFGRRRSSGCRTTWPASALQCLPGHLWIFARAPY